MNNGLEIFNSQEFGQIRTLQIDSVPWFVGKDVAEALGYVDAFGALKKHVDDEDKQNCQNDSFGTPRGMTIINESGLYALIFGSKLDSAKRFKRWVTSDVLPALRKSGHYEMPGQNTVNIDDVMDTVQLYEKLENRGNSAESIAKIVGEVFARRYGASKKILPAAGCKKKSLPNNVASDEKYPEYAEQVKKLGFLHKNKILVFPDDFKNFCADNKISARKFKKWLYHNGHIKGSMNGSGKLDYTSNVWHDGKTKRFIILTMNEGG